MIGEKLISKFAIENNVNFCSLRYFNVAGAKSYELRDSSKNNLIPIVIERLKSGKAPIIYGNDYPTRDGTCIRDYIHVSDLAKFHALAAELIISRQLPHFLNIGTGEGHTVLEVTKSAIRATNSKDEVIFLGRRSGDPAELVADTSLATKVFDYRCEFSLDEIIKSVL